MAFCPPAELDDLAEVLAEVRTWERVVEKKPGVFYVGRQPFLHFHLLADGRRRADVKGFADWSQVDVPRPASPASRRALLRVLRTRFSEKGGRRG